MKNIMNLFKIFLPSQLMFILVIFYIQNPGVDINPEFYYVVNSVDVINPPVDGQNPGVDIDPEFYYVVNSIDVINPELENSIYKTPRPLSFQGTFANGKPLRN